MCDCNLFCKIICAIILAVAFLVNTVGGWIGVGDIIPTEHCIFGCEETTTEESTEPSSEEGTGTTAVTLPSTESSTSSTTASTTEISSSTEPETEAPSVTTSTTKHETTAPPELDIGPHIVSAEETSLDVFGGSDDDIYKAVAPTSDGGFVACGTTYSKDGDFEDKYSGSNYKTVYSFVARYNSSGSLRWLKIFGTTDASFTLNDIVALDNNSFIAVGSTSSSEYSATSKTENSIDAVILNLTFNGNIRSYKSFGGKNTDVFYSVDATETGFVVGGVTYSTDENFDDTKGTSALIMSFDTSLNLLWKDYLYADASAYISDVACDSEGNIFASCITTSTGGDFEEYDKLFGGYTDTLVLKYDSTGKRLWGYEISSSGRDSFSSITPDGNGGCVVAGYYELIPVSYPDGSLSGIHNSGEIDSLVFRINPNGTLRWVKSVSGFKNDIITDVVKADGGFVITGYTNSSNRDFATIENEGDNDGFVLFINTNGVTVEMFSQAGSYNDAASCATVTTNGIVVVCGKTNSTDVDFQDLNTNSNNSCIGYISKFTTVVT